MAPEHEQCREVVKHTEQIKNLKESEGKQWDAIDKLRNRLPHWATLLIAILVGMIGWLVKS